MPATTVTASGSSSTLVSRSNTSDTPRIALLIKNTSTTESIYLSDVTPATTDGWEVAPGEEERFWFEGNNIKSFFRGAVYVITDGSNIDVRVWELFETKR